jgi:hypothetical protein
MVKTQPQATQIIAIRAASGQHLPGNSAADGAYTNLRKVDQPMRRKKLVRE